MADETTNSERLYFSGTDATALPTSWTRILKREASDVFSLDLVPLEYVSQLLSTKDTQYDRLLEDTIKFKACNTE